MSHGRNSTTVTIRIPDNVLEYINKQLPKRNLTRNEYINIIIANATIRKR